LTTTIHLLGNALGQPLDFVVSAGQGADGTQALPLLGERKAEAVLGDKGDEAEAIVPHIEASGAEPVIPPKANRKVQRPSNKVLSKQRHQIERCFSKRKQFRRVATRFEKNSINFQAVVALGCSVLLLA
jgi:transposase